MDIQRDENGMPIPKLYGNLKLWEHNNIFQLNHIHQEPYLGEDTVPGVLFIYDPVSINYNNENDHGYVNLKIRVSYPKTMAKDGITFDVDRFFSIEKDGHITKEDLHLLKQYAAEEFTAFVKERGLTDLKGNPLKLPDYKFKVVLFRDTAQDF